MLIRMSQPDRPSQELLTPEARRTMLRAFGDRMLVKISAMDDPEDMPGVERAVRVAAMIERIYNRCDRAEAYAPDPDKLEAERARHKRAAIQARFELASSLEWNEKNRKRMGNWLDAAETAVKAPAQPQSSAAPMAQTPTQATPEAAPRTKPTTTLTTTAISALATAISNSLESSHEPASADPMVTYVDYTDDIRAARRALGLKNSDDPPAAGRDRPFRPPGGT